MPTELTRINDDVASATAGELNPVGGLRRQRILQRLRLKRHCFLRFVIVFMPSAPVVAEKLTRSPAWISSNDWPFCTLNCSAASPVLAPTVPFCVCLIASVSLRRLIPVIVPVSACWARAPELRTMRAAAAPAEKILAIVMAISGFWGICNKRQWVGLVPADDAVRSGFPHQVKEPWLPRRPIRPS